MNILKKFLEFRLIMVYNKDRNKKEEYTMAEFFRKIEVILIDMWNYLYRFLAHLTGETVDDDLIVDPPLK